MLYELRVENLLLMERAELRLAPGLNILTGETGAGKTLLAHALDLLLGGKARHGIVREGASEAYVEGVFSLPPGLDPELTERIPDGAEEVVLARRVWPDGRTRAYVCGRSATLADLRELGGRLLAFYGQHEHRRLMLAASQLEILDAYCGAEARALRDGIAVAYERVRQLRQLSQELRELAGARDRELDLVRYELEEIEAADPSEAEYGDLVAERDRLRHLEGLRGAALAGAETLTPEEGDGVAAAVAAAAAQLEDAARLDPDLGSLAQRLQSLRYEAEDIGHELRSYLQGLESDASPATRLEQVEDRLAVLSRLERKHGGSIADVLQHADRCRERRDQLEHADVALEDAEREAVAASAELDDLAAALSALRAAAAPRLAAAVSERLAELAMADARFQIELTARGDGCGPRGADHVELSISSAPGLPAGPLREIASGGELSRVMLALLSVAHGESTGELAFERLLVFDEIDAGIGGHTARAVGEHLRKLAGGRQILCITHLPQVAALGSRHFTIVKDTSVNPARTTVTPLDGEGVVGELVRMLGADDGDKAASRHAKELLRAA